MSKPIKIRKGLNIKLKGKAEKILVKAEPSDKYAVKPVDFAGLIPKMLVKEGDAVKSGTALFVDKNRPEVLFASPVSGTVESVVRSEKRRILEVVVKSDGQWTAEDFSKIKPENLNKETITEYLLAGGVWPFIRQRPYAIVANPKDTPKSIFISCFDTAPLAPDYDFIFQNVDPNFQTGIDTLTKLTSGKVHLCVHTEYPPAACFAKAKNVEIHQFSGPHPAGNVGVQIHHIDPVNKGETVWYVNPQDVLVIGRLMNKGEYDVSKTIVLCGSEIHHPRYYKVRGGCRMTAFADNVETRISAENVETRRATSLRYISGNVLTGARVAADGYLGFYDSQVTVIPEGDHYEFLGWAMPGFGKYSAGRTFFSWLMPSREYRLDTNLNGGRRSIVMTGQYERVLPMDIYPEHLLKAILAGEIEKMEQLGIYEVAEEDFALCEFVCTSKTDVQAIIREGIDMMIKEMS